MSKQLEFDFVDTTPLALPEDQKRFNAGKPRMHYALGAPNAHQTMSMLGLYEYSSNEHNLLQCAHEFMRGFIDADTFVALVCQLAEDMTGQCAAELYQAVAEFGEQKYDRGNYLKGAAISQYLDSWLRHFVKLCEGVLTDDESGCLHVAHIVWNSVEAARWVGHPTRDNRLVSK